LAKRKAAANPTAAAQAVKMVPSLAVGCSSSSGDDEGFLYRLYCDLQQYGWSDVASEPALLRRSFLSSVCPDCQTDIRQRDDTRGMRQVVVSTAVSPSSGRRKSAKRTSARGFTGGLVARLACIPSRALRAWRGSLLIWPARGAKLAAAPHVAADACF
jgi:hypothetical protein